jgi:hypothetical protein
MKDKNTNYQEGDYIEVEELDGQKVQGRIVRLPDKDKRIIQGFNISSKGVDINYKPGQYKNVKKIPFTGEVKRKMINNEWWLIMGYESGDFAVYDIINTHSNGEKAGAAPLNDIINCFHNKEDAIKYLNNSETFNIK